MSRFKIRTLLVAGIFFTIFAVLSTLQALRMLEAKGSAQDAFDKLSLSLQRCSSPEVNADACDEQVLWKKQFDVQVGRMEHHRSLTLVFLVFAIFLPSLTVGFYFLTTSIFDSDA